MPKRDWGMICWEGTRGARASEADKTRLIKMETRAVMDSLWNIEWIRLWRVR